jgi:hypothetical protein
MNVMMPIELKPFIKDIAKRGTLHTHLIVLPACAVK